MDEGLLYIATGDEKYVEEARTSAQSARDHVPGVSTALIADRTVDADVFDVTLTLEDPEYGFIDRVDAMTRTPFEKTLYLDTDTYVCGDLSDVFDLLDAFDIAAAHAPGRRYDLTGGAVEGGPGADIPESFPNFNCGAIAFRDTEETRALLDRWADTYRDHLDEAPDVNDQPAFREAVYESDLRVATLPPEYNCRVPFKGYVKQEVKLIHGESDDYGTLARKLNRGSDGRLFASVQVGDRRELLMEPDRWPRRLAYLRLSIAEHGLLRTGQFLYRWLRSDDREGLSP
jgi:hypothetical protein